MTKFWVIVSLMLKFGDASSAVVSGHRFAVWSASSALHADYVKQIYLPFASSNAIYIKGGMYICM